MKPQKNKKTAPEKAAVSKNEPDSLPFAGIIQIRFKGSPLFAVSQPLRAPPACTTKLYDRSRRL